MSVTQAVILLKYYKICVIFCLSLSVTYLLLHFSKSLSHWPSGLNLGLPLGGCGFETRLTHDIFRAIKFYFIQVKPFQLMPMEVANDPTVWLKKLLVMFTTIKNDLIPVIQHTHFTTFRLIVLGFIKYNHSQQQPI